MADHQPTPETPVAPVPRRRVMLIAFPPRAVDPVCRPAEELRRLLDAGALRHFVEECAEQADANDGLGNCHDATLALMADLIMAKAADYWRWCQGTVVPLGAHSWLERDGWPLTARTGKFSADVVSLDAAATKRWLATLSDGADHRADVEASRTIAVRVS